MSEMIKINDQSPDVLAARAQAMLEKQRLEDEQQRITSNLHEIDARLQEQIERIDNDPTKLDTAP